MGLNSLAPGLLLAAPQLGDPNFERTVILLGRHTPEGSLGWVINGRGLGRVADLLRESGLVPAGVTLPATPAFQRLARLGGPVGMQTGWLMYRRDPARPLPGEIEAGPELAVTGDIHALSAVIRGGPPEDFHLYIGYAGWGPGQLEGEVIAGAWLPGPVDADLLFDTPLETLWDTAYRRILGVAPVAFTSTRRGMA